MHCPAYHFSRHPMKSFLQIHKTKIELFTFNSKMLHDHLCLLFFSVLYTLAQLLFFSIRYCCFSYQQKQLYNFEDVHLYSRFIDWCWRFCFCFRWHSLSGCYDAKFFSSVEWIWIQKQPWVRLHYWQIWCVLPDRAVLCHMLLYIAIVLTSS